MRPAGIFALLLIFLICFTGLHYIVPQKNFFPPVEDFLPSELFSSDEHEVDSNIVKISTGIADLPTNNLVTPDSLFYTDSLYHTDSLSHIDSLSRSDSQFITDSLQNDSLSIDSQLKRFIDTLKYSSGQTRILYYGDSQIEGDRITSYLRQTLRTISGGSGPGLILPLMPVMYTRSVEVQSSFNWTRYNYLSYGNKEISHRKFGPFMTVCRYLPEGVRSEAPVKATVSISPSKMADSLAGVYDQLRIFYRLPDDTVNIKVVAGENVIEGRLIKGEGINEFRCSLNDPERILIEFTGSVSPDILGISIESEDGLIVDNLPQRGSAGLEFTMIDKKSLSESYRLIQPDLIVIHYGLNIVRNVKDDYAYYSRGLSRQIALLKEVCPGAPVVVIGITDMAEKEGDSLRSFRNIPAILNAQMTAAMEQDAVFWNAWEAMGGSSSIIRWSQLVPPLAQKDLVHLTYTGADTLTGMMIDFLLDSSAAIQDFNKVVRSDSVSFALNLSNDVQIEATNRSKVLFGKVFGFDSSRPLIFTAAAFWIFMLVVLSGYSLLFNKPTLRNIYLLIISLFFYYKTGGLFLYLLISVITTDYLCGILIARSVSNKGRRFFLLLSIISNVGLLVYFKYSGFITESINSIFATNFETRDYFAELSNNLFGTDFEISKVILPVGISFFTFQSLSYTIDVYRRKIEPIKSILDFGFYVSFFPQLVAGPIVRASEFIPQLYSQYKLELREFSHAVFMITKGLIKKIIISDFIAVNFVDRVFEMPSMYSGFENLLAVYGYGLQIYCDFSGYTDIAIGIALLFGFRLPVNFNSPYKASGLQDFWRRWHISLSRWLKDYLYIPLGGNRKGVIRGKINLIITMLIGGLWHGADFRFIIWGLLHGVGLVVEKTWQQFTGGSGGMMKRFFSIFVTFNFVNFCWIFFRAEDPGHVKIMLLQILKHFSPGNWYDVLTAYSSVFLIISAGYLVHFIPEYIKESWRGIFIKIPVPVQLTVVMIVAVMLYSMSMADSLPFIYFRF